MLFLLAFFSMQVKRKRVKIKEYTIFNKYVVCEKKAKNKYGFVNEKTRNLLGCTLEMVNLFISLERNTQFKKLLKDSSEILKELFLILSIKIKILFEFLVIIHGNFSRQHHNICVILINPLPATVL